MTTWENFQSFCLKICNRDHFCLNKESDETSNKVELYYPLLIAKDICLRNFEKEFTLVFKREHSCKKNSKNINKG